MEALFKEQKDVRGFMNSLMEDVDGGQSVAEMVREKRRSMTDNVTKHK